MIRLVRKIECPHCSAKNLINLEEYCMIDVIDEREMGEETEYSCEEEFQCEKCSGKFYLNARIWEYPEGAFNDQDIQIDPIEEEEEAD